MTNAAETERAPEESVQPSVSVEPSGKREAIENIVGMLPELDPAFVCRLASKLKEELIFQPPTEPPTGCDEIPTLAECKRIKALYPKIDLNHENFWFSLCDAFDETIGRHGWACIVDVAEFVERWTPDNSKAATPDQNSEQRDAAQPKRGELRWFAGALHGIAEDIDTVTDALGSITALIHPYTDSVSYGSMKPCLPEGHTGAVECMICAISAELGAVKKQIRNEARCICEVVEIGGILNPEHAKHAKHVVNALSMYQLEEIEATRKMLDSYRDQKAVERRRIDEVIANWQPVGETDDLEGGAE